MTAQSRDQSQPDATPAPEPTPTPEHMVAAEAVARRACDAVPLSVWARWPSRSCERWLADVREDVARLLSRREREAVERVLTELDQWWSFDDRQHHTHSWHTKQDFLKMMKDRGYRWEPAETEGRP